MNLEIYIAPYTFYINVTDYSPGYPAKLWGPWENCYEECPEEISWECSCVKVEFEDGSAEETTVDIDEYVELIEEKIFDHLREMKQYSEEYY